MFAIFTELKSERFYTQSQEYVSDVFLIVFQW